jgi:hypothetical protein
MVKYDIPLAAVAGRGLPVPPAAVVLRAHADPMAAARAKAIARAR